MGAKRARADIWFGHRGLGPETGVFRSSNMGAPFGLLPNMGPVRRWYSSQNNGLKDCCAGLRKGTGLRRADLQCRVADFTWESVSSLSAAFQSGVLVNMLSCDRNDFAGRVSYKRPVQINGRRTCV